MIVKDDGEVNKEKLLMRKKIRELEMEAMQGHADYTQDLLKMHPELAFYTDKALIES